MTKKQTAPFGSWQSPINAEQIASATLKLSHVQRHGNATCWSELRPAENGRCAICHRADNGALTELTPQPYNARTRVHEYGGGAYLRHNQTLYFSNFEDQRIYRVQPGTSPEPLTPKADMRYADSIIDQTRNRIICVREDHTHHPHEPRNTIVAISLNKNQTGKILIQGNNFYSTPRLSPDGSQLAWLTWNHPDMPWDAAQLWSAPINPDGTLAPAVHIAGGANESIFQPQWSPDGTLHFISDRTGWWNLCRLRNRAIQPLTHMQAEFGLPQWSFGMSTYAFLDPETIICAYTANGIWNLAQIHTPSSNLQQIPTPYNTISDISADNGIAAFIAASADQAPAVICLDPATGNRQTLRTSSTLTIPPQYISQPQAIEFPTANTLTAHGLYYPPQNPNYTAPPEELPPLLVMVHGGPTASASAALRPEIQYYTSRGIAVLDLNYRGSTGYGRAYRQQLYGNWGIADVDDSINSARYLVQQGKADPNRLAISGGSAGGYTTLAALTFRDTFAAGASRYGVSDCEALAKDTHKFESHYLDKLIGPYPQRRDLYRERSPLHHAHAISSPVIFFQGLEDKIVPPDQTEKLVAILRAKGIPVAYLPFPGEQHGFRKAQNIRRALEAELSFLSRTLPFPLHSPLPTITIHNLND